MPLTNNIENYSTIEGTSNKILETKQLLDEIHSQLRGLKNNTDINKIEEISSKIEELNNNSLEYSNLHQREIKILGEILKDFKGETGRKLDREGIIDFRYNFREFSEKIKQKVEIIKEEDVSIIYLDKFSKDTVEYKNKSMTNLMQDTYDFMFDLVEYIHDNNQNTKAIFIDIDLPEVFYKSFEKIQMYYKSDIKIILGSKNDYKKGISNKYNLFFGNTEVDKKKTVKELSFKAFNGVFFKHKGKSHRGVIDDIVTTNKDHLSASDTINILLNPRNLLKFKYGEEEYTREGKKYYSKDYKGTNHDFNILEAGKIGGANNIPDTKIILIGNRGRDGTEEKDVYIDSVSGKLVGGTEIIANSIVDNDMNK